MNLVEPRPSSKVEVKMLEPSRVSFSNSTTEFTITTIPPIIYFNPVNAFLPETSQLPLVLQVLENDDHLFKAISKPATPLA